MVSLFAKMMARSGWLRVVGVCAFLAPQVSGLVQIAGGVPTTAEVGRNVRVPLYFYADESILAGQFDLSVPNGWSVLSVESNGELEGIHSIEAESLPGGSVRVVVFSGDNSEIPIGSLGTVLLAPPSIGEIADLNFSNPLFISRDGETTALSPGFPVLQIVGQPLSRTVLAGQRTLLSVSILGIDVTYAWFEGDSGDTTTPVGLSSALFQTPVLNENQRYWVRITDTFGTSVDSVAAVITVDSGPTYIFTPNGRSVGWLAGSGNASLETPVGNVWTAVSSAEWLVLQTSSGTGPGTIAYSYLANHSPSSRSANLIVGGVTYSVTQSARPSMFADYPKIDEDSEWRWVPWFGYIADTYYPWVYHRNHGWLYIYPTADSNNFYAYSMQGDLGWLYISTSFYNESIRWMYSFKFSTFLFFYPIDSLNPDSRLFYRADEKRWFSLPEE